MLIIGVLYFLVRKTFFVLQIFIHFKLAEGVIFIEVVQACGTILWYSVGWKGIWGGVGWGGVV